MAESRYQAFAAAAEEHSLTRAAEKLGYTQSGVSHLIDSLEEELGLKLLVRAKSGTRLTDAGEELLPYVRRLLAAAEDVSGKAGELKGLDTGRVRVGTFSSVAIQWLPELLRGFGEKYPGIETVIFNDTYSAVEDALLGGRVDCAFVPLPSRPEFKTVFLASDRLMAILPGGDKLAKRRSCRAAGAGRHAVHRARRGHELRHRQALQAGERRAEHPLRRERRLRRRGHGAEGAGLHHTAGADDTQPAAAEDKGGAHKKLRTGDRHCHKCRPLSRPGGERLCGVRAGNVSGKELKSP
jgi:DNA-binding transcriptional LysR family regulator